MQTCVQILPHDPFLTTCCQSSENHVYLYTNIWIKCPFLCLSLTLDWFKCPEQLRVDFEPRFRMRRLRLQESNVERRTPHQVPGRRNRLEPSNNPYVLEPGMGSGTLSLRRKWYQDSTEICIVTNSSFVTNVVQDGTLPTETSRNFIPFCSDRNHNDQLRVEVLQRL